MVPFTIFQRLSSLGSGGGVKAGTISLPDADNQGAKRLCFCVLLLVYLCCTWRGLKQP